MPQWHPQRSIGLSIPLAFIALTVIMWSIAVPTIARADQTNVELIIDDSGSMAQRIGGGRKIDVAKQVFSGLIQDLPSDAQIAVRTYGRRQPSSKRDCSDMELMTPFGPNIPDRVQPGVKALKPNGMTPIAASLEAAAKDFAGKEHQNNIVVLLSDGEEDCNGDPCAAAKALHDAEIHLEVNVIGLHVSPKERSQLQCVANAGGGKYYDAANANELKLAASEVKERVVAPPAPPAPGPPKAPAFKEYFSDNFDGSALKGHWKVLNANTDQFVVEKNELLILSSKSGKLTDESIPNSFRLEKPMPDGDWVMTAKVKLELQTGKERFSLGLYADKQNSIMASVGPVGFSFVQGSGIQRSLTRLSKGESTSFDKSVLLEDGVRDDVFTKNFASKYPAALVRLSKTDHDYVASFNFADGDPKAWIVTEKITALRAGGQLFFALNQVEEIKGQSAVHVKSVKIEVPQ